MNDELRRYPYVFPTAYDGAKAGFGLGFVVGLGAALIVVALSAWVLS